MRVLPDYAREKTKFGGLSTTLRFGRDDGGKKVEMTGVGVMREEGGAGAVEG